MKRYYTVFDVTPYEMNQTNYLHVGLGLKSAAAFVPDYSYNPATDPGPSKKDPEHPYVVPNVPTDTDKSDGGSNAGFMVFLFVLAIGLVIGVLLWRRKKRL